MERFIQTTETELWMIEGTEPTVEEINRKLLDWIRIYNFIRPTVHLTIRLPLRSLEEKIRRHLQDVHHVMNSYTYLTSS